MAEPALRIQRRISALCSFARAICARRRGLVYYKQIRKSERNPPTPLLLVGVEVLLRLRKPFVHMYQRYWCIQQSSSSAPPPPALSLLSQARHRPPIVPRA